MDYVILANCIVSAFIFSIWSKSGWANLAIKMIFFAVTLMNVLRLAGKI